MKTKSVKIEPITATPIAEGKRMKINPKLIEAHPHNRTIDRKTCQGLADSMRLHGQIQPATVRPHPTKKGLYQLGAGARRWHAASLAQIALDCIVRDLSDAEIEAMLTIENHQRENPDPREEAAQIRRFVKAHPDTKPATLAAMMGREESWVKRRLRLLDLIDPVHEAWQDPESNLHSLPIATMELVAQLDNEKQMAFLSDWGEDSYDSPTHQSVVDWITSIACSLKNVDWLDNPATFIPGCGPGCATSSNAGDLFANTDFAQKDRLKGCANCLNPECFNKRKDLARAHTWQTVIARAPKGYYAITDRYSDSEVTLADESTLKPRRKWDFSDWKACKKTDPNAKPFIEENGTTIKLTWKAPPKDAEVIPKSSEETAVKTPEETQQASIDRVIAKRLDLVLTELRTHLKDCPLPQFSPDSFIQLCHLIRLASIFGTDHALRSVNSSHWPHETLVSRVANKNDAWAAYHQGDSIAAEKGLWKSIRDVLEQRLRDREYTERKSDLIKPKFQDELRNVAALTGFDYTGAMVRAISTVKIPASLKDLDPVTFQPKKA